MQLWADKIRSVVPYTPGEQPNKPGMVKINTNENPYPPSPKVQQVLKEFEEKNYRLYPDPEADVLVSALADAYGVSKDKIFVGVGSDDVLAIAFMTFYNSQKPILFPDVTYSFYPVWADLFKIPYETCPVTDALKIEAKDYYRENGGVIFPNPNAPTSYYENLDVVEDIIRHNQDVIVIVDEAYIDYADGPSALTLLDKYDNLVVVQTYSKSRSMAGMRIGFAIGNPELIRAMNDVKFSYNSYTMNWPSQICGAAALSDVEYFEETILKIRKTREQTTAALRKLGFVFPEPSGNFVFASHPNFEGRVLFEKLREKDIFVRHFSSPRIANYLRISIGTDDEMDLLFKALEEIMSQS